LFGNNNMTQIKAWNFIANEFDKLANEGTVTPYNRFGICNALATLLLDRCTSPDSLLYNRMKQQIDNDPASKNGGYWWRTVRVFDDIIPFAFPEAEEGARKRAEWIRTVAIPSSFL
jgi:hypothetical protein